MKKVIALVLVGLGVAMFVGAYINFSDAKNSFEVSDEQLVKSEIAESNGDFAEATAQLEYATDNLMNGKKTRNEGVMILVGGLVLVAGGVVVFRKA